MSTGIRALTRRAVRANLRGLPNDSMYSTASLVSSSCSHHISMSLLDTSSLLPTEANEEIPMPSLDRWSTIAKPRPPDCMTRPAAPGAGWEAANVASSPMPGTATPKQFGPISRIPCLRQMASRSAQAAMSSPAVNTTRAADPARAACLGDVCHGRGGDGDHRQVGGLGQVGDRGQAPLAADLPRVGVHRVEAARVSAGPDVVQHRPADRALPSARADHRDRFRGEYVPQAGGVRAAFPPGYRVQVGV